MSSLVCSMTNPTSLSSISSHRACAADVRSPCGCRELHALQVVNDCFALGSALSPESGGGGQRDRSLKNGP
jgi:hypothetical protein